MRLEYIGAALIIAAIVLFKIGARPPYSLWKGHLVFGGFIIMALGAVIGAAGMIATRVERRRKRDG
jgi:hypothetical protein